MFWLFVALTYTALLAITALYVGAIVAACRLAAIGVVEAQIGVGPTLWSSDAPGFPLRIKALPILGYALPAGFAPADEDCEQPPQAAQQGQFRDRGLLTRLIVCLAGPIVTLALGLALLAVSSFAGAHLEVVAPAAQPVRPSAVPNLALVPGAPTPHGQLRLFRDTALEFVRRLVTLAPLEGWGFLAGFIGTSAAAATLSVRAWITCLGVIATFIGVYNVLPYPGLNGFRALLEIFLSQVPESLRDRVVSRLETLQVLGILILYALMARALLADVTWLAALRSTLLEK